MLGVICPNKSWPSYKQVVAKYGEVYAFNAWIMNGFEMFDSVAQAEVLTKSKLAITDRTNKIKKELLDNLKIQRAIYGKRASGKKYANQLDGVISELENNNDLIGFITMLEHAERQSAEVVSKLNKIREEHGSDFSKLNQDELAKVAETLTEIKRVISTYNILEDVRLVFPKGHPAISMLESAIYNAQKIRAEYKEIHQETLACWLTSQAERVNKNLESNKRDSKWFITKQKIKEYLTTAVSDISIWEKGLGAQASSKDPLTALIAARIKEESFKVDQENLDVEQELLGLYRATGGSNNPDDFNKKYIQEVENWEFIPDKDAKGNFIYNDNGKMQGKYGYVKRKAFVTEFRDDLYDKELREFYKTLPAPTSEENITKRMELLKAWKKKNTAVREAPAVLIARKKRDLTPLEFERWMAENTVRVDMKFFSNGLTNLDYFDKEVVHAVAKDGKSFVIYRDNSDFYRPAEKYRNPAFQKMMQDPYYNKLHEAYQIANGRVHHQKRLKYGIIPQVRKTSYDKYINGTSLPIGKQLQLDFGHAINVESYDTSYGLQTPDNKEVRHIPIYYTEMLEDGELSTDLLESTLQYYQMANNYNSKSHMEPFIEMVYDAVNGNDVVKIDPREVQTLTAKGTVKKNAVTGKALSARTDNVNEALIEFLDKVIYGEYEIPEIVNFNDKEISINKLANMPIKWASLNGLAFNVNSFFNNTLLGNFTMAIESLARENIKGLGTLAKAEAKYFAGITGFMKDLSAGRPVSKLGKLAVRYDAIQGEHQDTYGQNLSGNALKRAFTTNSLFFLTKGAEHQIQITGMIAMMESVIVKYTDGSESTLFDAYDDNGNLKPGAIWSKEDQFNFMQKLHSMNKKMHGIYNKYDSPTLQRKWYGKLALLFRKWIYSGWMRRWSGEYLDIEAGDVEQGYYNYFMKQLWSELKQGKADMLLGRNLSDKQKALRMKAMGEIVSLMAIMGLYAALKGDDDDDEAKNTWVENQILLQTRRLGGDLMFFIPVINTWEAIRIVTNPTVCVTFIEKGLKFGIQLLNPDERYQRNEYPYEKGDLKLEKRLTDIMPLYGQIVRATTPQNQLSEYNRSPLDALFTPDSDKSE